MGYHNQQYIDDCYVEHFIECAQAGDDLLFEWPVVSCDTAVRHMPIDTRGNFEDQFGRLYDLGPVNVFVPDNIFMMVQPIIEPKPAACPTTRPANDDQDVGYHGLKMSDL